MNKARIAITGMGAVTPIGIGVENYWQALLSGACGIDDIQLIDTSALPVHRAAEIRGFAPKDYLSSRLANDLDRFMQFAYIAAEEALRDARIEQGDARTGIVMGTALAGTALTGETARKLAMDSAPVGPRFVSQIMGNIAAAQLAIAHHITGPSISVSTACSSGGDAIMTACMFIQSGMADAVVVMAGEAPISPLTIASLGRARALSRSGRSLPFDAQRDGFVMGEGGGALILETEEHALQRGAGIHGFVCGCANTSDAYHVVSPEPNGRGAAACMRQALQSAGLAPADIGYINAHGTATHAGDTVEARAIHDVFGDYRVSVSSTKGATGHMMAAGGITETIACIRALESGVIPPNTGCTQPDSECDLNIPARAASASGLRYAMSNAFGFGGQNSCVIVGKNEAQ